MDCCEPPVSLWETIRENTGVVELDELRQILGPADVDISLDLRLEVESLREILYEMREEKQTNASYQLIDQNETRRRLVSDIKVFCDSIKNNPNFMGAIKIESITSRPIVKLALAEYDRSHSSLGSDGRSETASALESPIRSSSSRASINHVSYDDLLQMKDQFNISRVLEIIQHLKQYLADEIAQLKDGVLYLRNAIDEESYLSTLSSSGRASVAELKTERNEVAAEIRWVQDNVALLNSATTKMKRHGSLDPIGSSISRSSLSAMSNSSVEEMEFVNLEGNLLKRKDNVNHEPISSTANNPSTNRNIRIISPDSKAVNRSIAYRKTTHLNETNIANNRDPGFLASETYHHEHLGPVTSRPPLPPSSAKLLKVAIKKG